MTPLWVSVPLFLLGLALSAFFSGSETGFYRIPRIRLLIDALDGSWVARALLWLTNHPSLFVATTLIGNNIANYVTSAAIVLATSRLLGDGLVTELCAPIVLSPILFVYGELLPKNLFYYAPTMLLRAAGPLFLVMTILFAPVSVVLWAMTKVLEWIVGESPQRLRRRLARKELARVLDEGHVVGILKPSQRMLAQGIFAIAGRPVTEFITPVERIPKVHAAAREPEVLRLAREHDLAAVAVADNDDHVLGYVSVPDVYLDDTAEIGEPRELLEISATSTHLAALMKMQTNDETLARVVDRDGKTVGIVTTEQLSERLFHGGVFPANDD